VPEWNFLSVVIHKGELGCSSMPSLYVFFNLFFKWAWHLYQIISQDIIILRTFDW